MLCLAQIIRVVGMIYTIRFVKDERILGETPWDSGLDKAKIHAKDHMAIHKADRVEVRDEDNTLVFHYPRTLKNA